MIPTIVYPYDPYLVYMFYSNSELSAQIHQLPLCCSIAIETVKWDEKIKFTIISKNIKILHQEAMIFTY